MSIDARDGILIGSDNDWPKIRKVADALDEFDVICEVREKSANRSPHVVADSAATGHCRGLKVIIAAAGGTAHVAGVAAAHTTLPVIGLPVRTAELGSLESMLSTVQMPGDVPLATMAVGRNGPRNAGLFAVQIPATADESSRTRLDDFKLNLVEMAAAKNRNFQSTL